MTEIKDIIAAAVSKAQSPPRSEHAGMDVYVEISPGAVSIETQPPDRNEVRQDIYYGLSHALGLPNSLTPEAAAEWLQNHAEQVARVMKGLGKEWNGSNMVGTITPDAEAALRELAMGAEEAAEEQNHLWETGDIIPKMDAHDLLFDLREDIARAQSADEAATQAAALLDEDGICQYGEGYVYAKRDEVEAHTRELWIRQQREE